jgi:ketosteroid isomerase-like protein
MREALADLLRAEGYGVTLAEGLEGAGRALALGQIDLVLGFQPIQPVVDDRDGTRALVDAARPVPVGIVRDWSRPGDDRGEPGALFTLERPLDPDQLMAALAVSLGRRIDATEDERAAAIVRYFGALDDKDWDALAALCTEDVEYVPPGGARFADRVTGRSAFRAFSHRVFRDFPDARFQSVEIFSGPRGLVARYLGRWTSPGSGAVALPGAVSFRFRGGSICRIGVRLDAVKLEALAPTSH